MLHRMEKGRSKRSEHLVNVKYIDSDGEVKTKKSITYNPRIKTKLMGVMADSLIRQSGEKSPYRKIYDDYKNRIVQKEAWRSEMNEKYKELSRAICN